MSACSPPKGVVVARELWGRSLPPVEAWALDALAGRFVEIGGDSATAALTVSASLIVQAQRQGEPAVWIGGLGSTFFPPDFAAAGVELDALPVVRVDSALAAAQAADTLLRSGGFAVVVLDLGPKAELPLAVQTRLVGLAQKHHTALLALTRQTPGDRPRGSLASLRAETLKSRTDHDCFACELRIVKDKRRTPGRRHTEVCRGPDGLC